MINGLQTKCAPLFSSINYSIDEEGPIIVADHLKSPENIGHIIRLASNFGCSKVLFVGDEDGVRHTKVKRVAGAAAGQVEWQFSLVQCFIAGQEDDLERRLARRQVCRKRHGAGQPDRCGRWRNAGLHWRDRIP